MKFLQIRAAIESLPELRRDPEKKTERKPKPSQFRAPTPTKERVEGNPTRKPVDRVAARVIAPASWIHKPPMDSIETTVSAPDGGILLTAEQKDSFVRLSMKRRLKVIEEAPEQIAGNVTSVEEQIRRMHAALGDLEAVVSRHVQSMRSLRMTAVADAAQVTKVLGDIRTLFIGPDHTREMERLEHFVNLCERIQVLKKNGTLDAVADTILKLSD